MKISGSVSLQAVQFKPRSERLSGGMASFESQLRDRVTLSNAATGTSSSSVLSASEKSFFNKTFGMKVFSAEHPSSGVIGSQAAAVLNPQEISYFENTLSSARGYGRNGAYAAQGGSVSLGLNRNV